MENKVMRAQQILTKNLAEPSMYSTVRCYAAIKALYGIMQKTSWKYPSAAWKHNADAICSRVGGQVFSQNFTDSKRFFNDFAEIYDLLSQMGPDDFFLHFMPGFIAQPSRTFEILNNLNIRYPEFFPLSILYAKESHLSPELRKKPPRFIMPIFGSEVIWNTFANAVNSYPYSYTRRKYTSAMAVVDIFKKHNCNNIEFMASVYNLVRAELFNNQFIGRKLHLQRSVNDAAASIRKNTLDLLGTDAAVNEAAARIGKIASPIDFLEVALIDPDNDDCKIEHDFIYTKFIEHQYFKDSDHILIINAAPSFILKYSNTQLMPRTTFVMGGPNVAEAIRHQFGDAIFLTLKELEESETSSFNKILFFSRGMHSEERSDLLRCLSAYCAKDARICAIIPSELATWNDPKASPLASLSIEQIDLLPKTTFNSAPKKKVVVYASLSAVKTILLSRYAFTTDSRERLEMVESGHVTRDMLKGNFSIYDVLKKANSPQGENVPKRNPPSSYAFTKDINFWYVRRNGAKHSTIEAYVCTLPTHEQIKRKKIVRGKKIPESSVSISTLKSQEEIDNWFENILPYQKCIHENTLKAYKGTSAESLSFKTLWYLQLDLKNIQYSETFEDELLLVSSEVGASCYGEKEAFLRAMNAFCDGMSTTAKLKYWYIVRRICAAVASKNIVIADNIASKPIRELRKQEDGHISEVKDALAVRSFSAEQEIKLLSFLNEKIVAFPEYLGVLIRFYTGLTPNVVSALTWKDLKKIPHVNCYQLYISKQHRNDSAKPVPFQNAEDYRCIPICSALSTALLARKKRISQEADLAGKIDELQIIASDKQLSCEDPKRITPRHIHALSRKTLGALNMEDQIVDLPDGRNGTQETNLASVTRDIFRSNFKYHTNFTCGFTNAESRYVLGLAQETAYARNYCDYLNDFCQYTMYTKLCRWTAMHEASLQPAMAQTGCVSESKSLIMPNRSAILLMEVSLDNNTTIILESHHGMDVHASRIMTKGGQP